MGLQSQWDKIAGNQKYWHYSPKERANIKAAWFDENIAITPEFEKYSPDDQGTLRDHFLKPEESVSPDRTFGGTVADIGLTAVKSVIGAGEAAVGIADIPTMGHVGGIMQDWLGYEPGKAREILDKFYSPAQKAAFEKVEWAKVFIETVTEAVKNPSTIAHMTLESLPAMMGGAAIAKKLGALGMGELLSLAIGEGLVSAGMSAEGIRAETEDKRLTPVRSGMALATGAITGAISLAGAGVARKFGFVNPEALFAGWGIKGRCAGRRSAGNAFGWPHGRCIQYPSSDQGRRQYQYRHYRRRSDNGI